MVQILCAHHAQSKEACEWVLMMYEHNHDPHNSTVVEWIKACKAQLELLSKTE